MDKIKSIVAFKMSELVTISKDGYQKISKRWVKEEPVISDNLQSMFLIALRREDRSLLCMGQWSKKCVVDSTLALHLHNGFSESWKLCLNLCSRRWLRPRRSLVRNLIPYGLWHSNTLLGYVEWILQIPTKQGKCDWLNCFAVNLRHAWKILICFWKHEISP